MSQKDKKALSINHYLDLLKINLRNNYSYYTFAI